MTTRVPMTKAGADKLQEVLQELKKRRPQISEKIKEARAHGDLKENAEYHAAKEEQGMVEAKIRDIEHKLSNAHIIDPSTLPQGGKVVFGVTVELMHIETEATISYQIVGEDEADVNQGKISVTSPIARALISKEIDEEVTVITPRGEVTYVVVDVKYL